MGRRSEHSRDEIRDMALNVAAEIVEGEGFQALTARKVAAGIGYTVGTLYHVFRNFDDLVMHLNGRTLDEMAGLMDQETRRRRNPVKRIRAMAAVYARFATEHPHRWRLVFEHRFGPDAQVPDEVLAKRGKLFEQVAECFRQIAPARSDAELSHSATALWSGIHGVCILALSRKLHLGGPSSMVGLMDTLIDAVIVQLRTND